MRRVSAVEELPEHVRRNRAHWDAMAPDWAELGRRRWAEEPSWGIWAIPETDIRLLPDDLAGMDAIELGCGTAYVSAWLARRGARPVGIDNSARQLEAARLLRPGGRLVFLGNHTLLQLCAPEVLAPAGDRLLRDYFRLHRLEWADDDSVEFALPYGEWFRLLRSCGFEVTDLLELRAPADPARDFPFVTAEWARRWPSEHVFTAVKRG